MKHFYANVTEVGTEDKFCGGCREKLNKEQDCPYCGARINYDSVMKMKPNDFRMDMIKKVGAISLRT